MHQPFRQRFGEERYPIGRLTVERATALGISRSELVRRLGYTNLSKGHRALSFLLLDGTLPPFIGPNLATALEVDAAIIAEAIAATQAQQEAEEAAQRLAWEHAYYAAFRPHLRAETERRVPEPIFVAAMCDTPGMRLVEVSDEVFRAEEATRDTLVRAAILSHYRERQGRVLTFGAIVGYALTFAPAAGCDLALPYDVAGNRAGPLRTVHRLGIATFSVKGRPLSAGLTKMYGFGAR